jgi:alginate O-acetyltransferase complex protein AlgI
MDFSSLTFLFIFFPIFLALYLLAKPSFRLFLVSIANIFFIAAGQFIALLWLAGIALVGYAFGRLIESKKNKGLKTSGLILFGIGMNLGLLIIFKLLGTYGINPSFKQIFPSFSGIVAPLGLSYITFQIISYIVDVSRGTIPAENDIVKFITYILFFPKLVSGPITRYKQFNDQLSSLNPTIDNIAGGLRRVLIGVLKRILIANQLGQVANAVFNLPTPNIVPLFAWLALIAYTLQIYFDFSGYSDIAVGLGQIIGITLPENFNYPYIAQSISDFWRRWHITLSMWFREYVFYPLERHRIRFAGQQINLVIVFLLTGLWHGPTFTYLFWGLLHGLAIAFESTDGGRWLKTVWKPVRHLYAMFIIMLGWVFFRSPNISFAFGFITRLLGNKSGIYPLAFSQTSPLPFIEPSFVIVTIVAMLFSLPIMSVWKKFRGRMETSNISHFFFLQAIEDIAIIIFFVLSIAAQVSGTFQPNIYTKF